MRKVIYVGEEPKGEKGVEFTHYLDTELGWKKNNYKPSYYEKIIYLGKCDADGDMFATYEDDYIHIYKGNLNNGTF